MLASTVPNHIKESHALAPRGLVLKNNDYFFHLLDWEPCQNPTWFLDPYWLTSTWRLPVEFPRLGRWTDCPFILDGLRNGFNFLSESDTLCIDSYTKAKYCSATGAEFKPEVDLFFFSMNSLLVAFLLSPRSQSAFILSAAFLRTTRESSARSRIVADHPERPETITLTVTLNLF